MVQKLRERSNGEGGFTLVELLVVMLILGLLAAIAIPSFFNQRDKAADADAKAGVRTAQTAMETYATDNDNSYTGVAAAGTELKTIEETLNDYDITVSYPSGSAYRLAVESTTGTSFSITRQTGGTTVYTCDDPGAGGCPEGGEWAGTEPTP
jgi:type IV pilus assembly protein PilA